jgi:hypothetical protein
MIGFDEEMSRSPVKRGAPWNEVVAADDQIADAMSLE